MLGGMSVGPTNNAEEINAALRDTCLAECEQRGLVLEHLLIEVRLGDGVSAVGLHAGPNSPALNDQELAAELGQRVFDLAAVIAGLLGLRIEIHNPDGSSVTSAVGVVVENSEGVTLN